VRAALLLAEYLRRHDDGVRTGDFAPLAALFAEDGVLAFRGLPVSEARGPAAIESLFREHGPDDALVAGEIVGASGGREAQAVYGWRAAPDRIEGTLRLVGRDGRIARLEVIVRRGGAVAPTERRAARVLVLARRPGAPAEETRVLLLRCVEPMTGATWWITPGGGLDPGETWEDAARREMEEEVGRTGDALGPLVWTREHVFVWDHNVVRQREQYYVVEVSAPFAARPSLPADKLAREGLAEHRWWTLAELLASEADVFSPRRFAEFLGALLREGPPPAPIDTGV
jgi:8-oxo-dGTP pyrophosphatase MutT (NUDIX family)